MQMEKASLPQLVGDVAKESVVGFVNDTRCALRAPGAMYDLNQERLQQGLNEIEMPSSPKIIGESALRNGRDLISGVMAAVIVKTALKDIGRKFPIA